MDGKLSLNHLNFGTAEARVVKLCMHVVKYQHKDDKSALKEAWSGSCDPL